METFCLYHNKMWYGTFSVCPILGGFCSSNEEAWCTGEKEVKMHSEGKTGFYEPEKNNLGGIN